MQNEKHKQDLLQKQKDGKGHWKPELASDSEEAVSYTTFALLKDSSSASPYPRSLFLDILRLSGIVENEGEGEGVSE